MNLEEAKQSVANLTEDEAKIRLAWALYSADSAIGLHSMDNNDAPDEVEEIFAQASGQACTECGDYRRDYREPRTHYTHCSKYGEVL